MPATRMSARPAARQDGKRRRFPLPDRAVHDVDQLVRHLARLGGVSMRDCRGHLAGLQPPVKRLPRPDGGATDCACSEGYPGLTPCQGAVRCPHAHPPVTLVAGAPPGARARSVTRGSRRGVILRAGQSLAGGVREIRTGRARAPAVRCGDSGVRGPCALFHVTCRAKAGRVSRAFAAQWLCYFSGLP